MVALIGKASKLGLGACAGKPRKGWPKASRLAGRWRYTYARMGITLGLADTLIAAVAVCNSLALVTANDRHYPVKELIIITH